MNWLTNYVRPKIRALVEKKDVPDNLWHQCPSCEQMIFHRELEASLRVCSHCGHHMRLPAKERLALLFDNGEYQTVELPKLTGDPLKFKDLKRYSDRLKDTRNKTGEDDAMIVAHGEMGGRNVVIAIMNFAFMGGSMGLALGKSLLIAARLAVLQEAPLICFTSSGGARMQEGILSLMQMPRTIIAVDEVKEAKLPYITVLTDPTTGGVTASFAMLGDIAIAEPGAVIGFAGARVIEETIREKLPEGFQRAEYLLEHGMIDRVVHRRHLRDELVRISNLLLDKRTAAEVVPLKPSAEEIAKRQPIHRKPAQQRITTKNQLKSAPLRSDSVLDRLSALHPKAIDLSLGRTEELLATLGNPEQTLANVVHIAGTNGKGSTLAFLRAMCEAAGLTVNCYTSPHLIRFAERISIAGTAIDEETLTRVLEECEAANAGKPITLFEITTVAAFLAFSRQPADVTLIETGLGGRFDSTNVFEKPALTVITPVSMDHMSWLGNTLAEIAFEKAGILKPRCVSRNRTTAASGRKRYQCPGKRNWHEDNNPRKRLVFFCQS